MNEKSDQPKPLDDESLGPVAGGEEKPASTGYTQIACKSCPVVVTSYADANAHWVVTGCWHSIAHW